MRNPAYGLPDELLVMNWRRSSLTKAQFANWHPQRPIVKERNKWEYSGLTPPRQRSPGQRVRNRARAADQSGVDRHSRRGQEGFIIGGDAVAMGVLQQPNPTTQQPEQTRIPIFSDRDSWSFTGRRLHDGTYFLKSLLDR